MTSKSCSCKTTSGSMSKCSICRSCPSKLTLPGPSPCLAILLGDIMSSNDVSSTKSRPASDCGVCGTTSPWGIWVSATSEWRRFESPPEYSCSVSRLLDLGASDDAAAVLCWGTGSIVAGASSPCMWIGCCSPGSFVVGTAVSPTSVDRALASTSSYGCALA